MVIKQPYFFLFFATGLFFQSCQQEIIWPEKNQPPVAIAGPDQTISLPVNSVLLDGRLSTDDGVINEYKWSVISSTATYILADSTSATCSLSGLSVGIYGLELRVTDNGSLEDRDTLIVEVKPPLIVEVKPPGIINHPPVANAGDDQTITLPNHTVVLSGTSSFDPDNNINSYTWTKVAGPASYTIGNSSNALTLATNLTEGIYKFELKVTDIGGLSARDTMQATVLR
jgi:hypothetical protein